MSSTIWKSSPSSSPNARQGRCPSSGTRATQSASPTAASKRQPVFNLCSVASSGAVPVMSRYWPPIIPSVAPASSRATAGVSYDVARRKASARSASPARMPTASPYCFHVDGCPRRSSSASSGGRSSWTRENVCTSSSAQPAGSATWGAAPAASAVARQITGRTRLPPTVIEYRTDSAWPCSCGQSSSPSRQSSTRERSSSGLLGIRLRRPLGALQLLLDRLRELRQLAQDLERSIRRAALRLREPVELAARSLQPGEQLLRLRQRLLRAHAASL